MKFYTIFFTRPFVDDTGNFTGQPIVNTFNFGSVPSEVRKNKVKIAPSLEFTAIFVQGWMNFGSG